MGDLETMSISEEAADQLAKQLAQMDREGLVDTLRSMQCKFEMDFSDEFLDSVSIERLRHITLAASLHAVQES